GDPSMGTFSFDFSGLKDENTGGKNPHDVLVTASDACGEINGAQDEKQWTVDTTGDVNAFNLFVKSAEPPPSVDPVEDEGSEPGPEDAATTPKGSVDLTMFDAHSGTGNADEAHPTVTVSETGQVPATNVACTFVAAINRLDGNPCECETGADTEHWHCEYFFD